MKLAVLLLASVLVAVANGGTTCRIENGNQLVGFSERKKSINMPCKFNAVQQTCGDYTIRLSPDYQFVNPKYIIDSAWIGVDRTSDGKNWEGRTSNKLAGLFIIRESETGRIPVVRKEGSTMETDELFTFERKDRRIFIREINNVFKIEFGAYDFAGNKHKDSYLDFTCLIPGTVYAPYPEQFCGSEEGSELRTRTMELFTNPSRDDLTLLFDIFNNTSPVVQTDANCQSAVDSLTTVCTTDEKRKEAIRTCFLILANKGHTQCIAKHTCDPMDVFASCVKFACSDYTDKEACKVVGQGIDLCRTLEDLTPKIKGCYNDLLTAEDNPYYNPNKKGMN